MSQTRVVNRYAKSLLEQALEKSLLEVVHNDMALLLHTCKENKDFSLFLKSPIIKTEKKESILKELFSSKVNTLSLDFMLLIVTKKRENVMEAIAEEFINQYKIYKKGNQSEVELIEKLNSDLIGGFILRIGDKQVDTSILRQLKKLNRTFRENSLQ